MKKILLFVCCTVILFDQLQAQTYVPMLDTAAHWTGVASSWGGGNPPDPLVRQAYDAYIYGDSIINGKKYAGVYTSLANGSYSRSCFIREDSGGKVYITGLSYNTSYQPISDTTEHLLYDFSLQVGQGISDSVLQYYVTIVQIDTIRTNAGLRRRLFLTNGAMNINANRFWVEGVGGNQILQNDLISCFEGCWCLSAMTVRGQTVYENTAVCPFYVNGINRVPLANIHIYPIPAGDMLTIDMRQNSDAVSASYAGITLYNALGQKLRSLPRRDGNKLIEVSVNDMPDGVYLATITDAKGVEQVLGSFTVER